MSAIRKRLLLSKSRCEFRVLVTPVGDAGKGSTERRLLLLVLLRGHKQKRGSVSHSSDLQPSLLKPNRTAQSASQRAKTDSKSQFCRTTFKHT